jgi:KTSC domain-containing protein
MPSTVIKSISYESALSRLTVTFTTGRIYDYFAVPQNIADTFRSSFSKGTYFNTNIRDKYPCKERTRLRLAPKDGTLQEQLQSSAGAVTSDRKGDDDADGGADGGGADR